ncbi:Circularly permutated Ras protein 1 [Balamuthia mandrillaris]
MNFASKFVLACDSDEESLSEEELCYSDVENGGASSSSDSEEEDSTSETEKQEDRKRLVKKKVRKADTNVVQISLATLAEKAQLLTGDPIFCKSCCAALNHLSKITTTAKTGASSSEDKGGEEEEEDSDQQWLCEFCGASNAVHIEEEEKPTTESGDYILELAEDPEGSGNGSTEENGGKRKNGPVVIFCIDISGSMCVTTEVMGRHKLKGGQSLLKMQQELNTEGADQFMPRQNKDTTWVSRLQCVQAAVETYMDKLVRESPSTRVGLVTFNNDVTIIGDGTGVPQTITGDKLNQYDTLLELGKSHSNLLSHPIQESHEDLSQRLFRVEENGATALGPALLVSLGMASAQASSSGSQVIICTDGLANVGLGAQDELRNSHEKHQVARFYAQLGQVAAHSGISVSVFSIKGTEANMENLGRLADSSGGQVNVVDPLSLHKEFASILSDPIIATNVAVDLLLHRGLYFRNEETEEDDDIVPEEAAVEAEKKEVTQKEEGNKGQKRNIFKRKNKQKKKNGEEGGKENEKKEKEKKKAPKKDKTNKTKTKNEAKQTETEAKKEGSQSPKGEPQRPSLKVAKRSLGNVTKETQITFEFGLDKSFSIPKEVKELPFQVQIRFHTLDGNKCIRCITQALPVTEDRNLAEENANIAVLGLNIAQQSARMAFRGEYTEARTEAFARKKLLKRAKKTTNEDEVVYKNVKTTLHTMENHLFSAQRKERKIGLNLSDDEAESDDEQERKDARKKRREKKQKDKDKKKGNTKAKSAARQFARNDSTSTFLYRMKSATPSSITEKKSRRNSLHDSGSD